MSKKFEKLISEVQSICQIKGKITKENLIKQFLQPNLESLYEVLAEDIIMGKLYKNHIYRFQIQCHAKEID